MKRNLLVLVIFVYLINIGYTDNKLDEISKSGGYIYKCCHFGESVKPGRVCRPSHQTFNLSHISVYNEDVMTTRQTVPDVFTITPGKFINDPTFQKEALVMSRFGFKQYITESGYLLLELPNAYERWTRIDTENFCIDYTISKRPIPIPRAYIWSRIPVNTEDVEDSYMFLTYVMLVSCFFISLVLVVYILLPELRNLCGLILMAYLSNLFMAFLLLSVAKFFLNSAITCKLLTCGIYFFMLASFFWMNVLSYDIWTTFRNDCKPRPVHHRGDIFKFFLYGLYAWGLPLLMTIGLEVLNEVDLRHVPWLVTPKVPENGCFLDDGAKSLYMDLPMTILILCNWIFFLMTAFKMWQLNKDTVVLDPTAGGTSAHRTLKSRLLLYLKLSIVMGLNWVLEFISFFCPGSQIWYIIRTYNMLTGVSMFLIFVCKKRIFLKLLKRCGFKNDKC